MTLNANLTNLATRTAVQDKLLLTLISGNVPNLNALTTTDKTHLVAALNELKALIVSVSGSSVVINDVTASGTTTYSSNKVNTQISAAITAVINGAPGAFDTLKEISDYIASDQNVTTTLTTALSKRVAVDSAQAFTGPEKVQGRANIDAASVADVTAASAAAAAAQTSANAAQTTATSASTAAAAAQTTASTALTNANNALTNAATAQSTVDTLSTNVGPTNTDYVALYNAALV